jgi:hypothetical protein
MKSQESSRWRRKFAYKYIILPPISRGFFFSFGGGVEQWPLLAYWGWSGTVASTGLLYQTRIRINDECGTNGEMLGRGN